MASHEGKGDARSELTAYVQGELSREEVRSLELRLEQSEALRRELGEIREILQLFQKIPVIGPSPALERRLDQIFGNMTAEDALDSETNSGGLRTFELLCLLPAFLGFQLKHSRRMRGLAILTAAFALHATVLTCLHLLDLAGPEPEDRAELPERVMEPATITPWPGTQWTDEDSSTEPPILGELPDPTSGAMTSEPILIDPLGTPDPEVYDVVAPDIEGDILATSPEWGEQRRIEAVNLRTLRRLKMIARYDPDYRSRALASHGGGDVTEAKVEFALKWLRTQQKADGSWDPEGLGGYPENRVGLSALTLLAFLGRGSCSSYGDDREVVERGVIWLLSRQDREGGFGERSRSFSYGHGLATLALLENYALKTIESSDRELRRRIQKAVGLVEIGQNPDGGWGYLPSEEPSDVSSSSWQALVLAEARRSGFRTNPKTLSRYREFVDALTREDGQTLYASETVESVAQPSSSRLSAASLLAFQKAHLEAESHAIPRTRAVEEALARLAENEEQKDYHLVFFAMTALVSSKQTLDWSTLNRGALEQLTKWQDADGSFSPAGDPYGAAGGRLYSTAMATLALESYYR